MKMFLTLMCVFGMATELLAAEPPPLEKADAKRLLEAMEWQEVNIIAIRQGVDAKGAVAPIYATIVGLGKCRGEHRTIFETVYYDRELDWYTLELGVKSARMWNKEGYHEIKPWSTW